MSNNESLANKYIEFLDVFPQLTYSHDLPTWDDFFDYANIPKEDRTDFACAAIIKKVKERKQK